jgi:hypothetical protein
MAGHQHLRRGALALFVAVAAIACNGGDIASIDSPRVAASAAPASQDRSDSRGRQPRGLAFGWSSNPAPVSCNPHGSHTNSGLFGPNGGILIVGSSALVIPGGALHDTVTISGTIPAGTASTIEFQPHGLQFFKPVGLVLNGNGCSIPDGVVPDVVYLSDEGAVLEVITALYDPHWKTVAAPIQHFSGYAIAF